MLNDLIHNLINLGEINNLIKPHFKIIQSFDNIGSHHDLNKNEELTIEYMEPYIKSVAYIIKWYFKKFNIYLDEEQYNKELDEIEWTKAKELLEVAAQNGDALAQRYLGDLYFGGRGVEKNYEEAFKLYNESVSKGYIESSLMVGYSYLNGLGIKKDINKAISFLEIAACNNKVKAQIILGEIYYKGIQRDQDYKLAFEWYRKAAKNSSLEGIYMLGVMYYYGQGVVKNINESIRLLSIANKYRYFNDEHILEKAKAERLEMLFEENKFKGKDQLKLIADSFYYGNKESRCYKTAFKFYKLSAEKGNMKAMSSLAYMYLSGIGTSKNTKLAYA